MKTALYIAVAVVSFGLGVFMGSKYGTEAFTQQKPAYLVAGWDILHPEQTRPFLDAVMPLAQEAGLKGLAAAQPEVLEGNWPYRGSLIVQQYRSMDALKRFWHSNEHAEAKSLREGHIKSYFVVAVEAKAN